MRIAEGGTKAMFAAQGLEERRIAGQILARGKPAARRKKRWEASREAQRYSTKNRQKFQISNGHRA